MQKDGRSIMIAFRTSPEIKKSLEKVAAREKRSLSNVIETMLEDGLRAKRTTPAREKRLFPRHQRCLPALVRKSVLDEPHTGTVLDLSLCGIRISVPAGPGIEIREGEEDYYLHISFAIPQDRITMTVKCKPEWINRNNGNIDIGLSFDDCNFHDYRKLQKYLA